MKHHAETIASLAGPTLIAMGASLLLNRKSLPEMAAQISHDWAIVLLSGVLLLVAGLAIVRLHNDWSGGWTVLVTVLGWLAVAGGLTRILYPRQLAEIAVGVVQNQTGLVLGGLAVLLLGVFLTLKGYRLIA